MKRDIITSTIAIVVLTVLLGLVYPLVITGVSQVAFPGNANGQKIYVHGRLVGSKIIGQSFQKPVLDKNGKPKEEEEELVTEPDPSYFQSRPSATEGGAYNAAASTFSNRGPNDKVTAEADEENIKAYLALEKPYDRGLTVARIPVDAVTTSASNLDPEISQANAWIQAHRIAAVRHLTLGAVNGLIDKLHLGPQPRIPRRAGGQRPSAEPRPRPPHRRNTLMSAQRVGGTPSNERQAISLFQGEIVRHALIDSLKKLDPRVQVRNPVMFVVEIGALITTVTWLIQAFGGKPLGGGSEPAWYTFVIALWLWLTVVFANMAEAFAEGRGRAQADTLRSMRKETVATTARRVHQGRR